MAEDRRDVVIGVRSDGTDKTAAELRDVAAAERELSAGASAAGGGLETFASGVTAATSGAESAAAADRGLASALGTVAREGLEAAQGLSGAAEAVTRSGVSLEVQKVQLAAIASELTTAVGAYAQLGAEGKTAADAVGTALVEVKARQADVALAIKNSVASLREVETQGVQASSRVATGMLSVEQATKLVEAAATKTWETYESGGKITARQVAEVAQGVERLKISIVEQFGSIERASPEALASYQRLEGELTRVTERANLLTNAVSDNAVRLKESGNQVAGVGASIQQLTQGLGGTAAAFGNVAGQAGFMAGGIEQAKDAFKAMNLNVLDAGASTATLGVQAGLIVGTLIAAAEAGIAFAKTNEANVQIIDSLKEKFFELGGVKDTVTGFFNGMQTAVQNTGGSFINLLKDINSGDFGRLGDDVRDLNGELRRFDDTVHSVTSDMQRLQSAEHAINEERQKSVQALREKQIAELVSLSQTRGLTTEEKALELQLVKQRDAHVNLSQAQADQLRTQGNILATSASLQTAQAGTTAAIDQTRTRLNALTGDYTLHEVEIGKTITALQALLTSTDNLTTEQRAAIAAEIARAQSTRAVTQAEEALTAAQEAAKDANILQRQAAENHTNKVNDLAQAKRNLLLAVENAKDPTILESERYKYQAKVVDDLAEAKRKLAIATDETRKKQSEELAVLNDILSAMSKLTGSNRDLEKEQRVLLDLGDRMTTKQYERFVAIDREIIANNNALRIEKEKANSAKETTTATEAATVATTSGAVAVTAATVAATGAVAATEALRVATINGKLVITNAKTETEDHGTALTTYKGKLNDAAGAADILAGKTISLGTAHKNSALSVNQHVTAYNALAGLFDVILTKMKDVAEQAPKTEAAIEKMSKAGLSGSAPAPASEQ